MLKHLPPISFQTLLDIFTDIWETIKFPEKLELASFIHIPNLGKYHAEPTNFRPIAHTSCLCKIPQEKDQHKTCLVLRTVGHLLVSIPTLTEL